MLLVQYQPKTIWSIVYDFRAHGFFGTWTYRIWLFNLLPKKCLAVLFNFEVQLPFPVCVILFCVSAVHNISIYVVLCSPMMYVFFVSGEVTENMILTVLRCVSLYWTTFPLVRVAVNLHYDKRIISSRSPLIG